MNHLESLAKARKATRKALAVLAKAQTREASVLFRGNLLRDDEYVKSKSEFDAIKDRLHVIRINLNRKTYSKRSHLDHIDRLDRQLADFTGEEQALIIVERAAIQKIEEVKTRIIHQFSPTLGVVGMSTETAIKSIALM